MKFTSAFALVFACLVASSVFFGAAEAKKKKIIGALLLGAALASKPKLLPLPLPVPVSVSNLMSKYWRHFSCPLTDPNPRETWKVCSIPRTSPLPSLVSIFRPFCPGTSFRSLHLVHQLNDFSILASTTTAVDTKVVTVADMAVDTKATKPIKHSSSDLSLISP